MLNRAPLLLLLIGLTSTLHLGCGPAPQAEARTYSVGERVEAGIFGYHVSSFDWATQIGAGPEAKTAAQRFLIVRLDAFNRSSTDQLVPPLTLMDDSDQIYPEVTAATADSQWLGLNRKVGANETGRGNVIFDVPLGHYRLRLVDATNLDQTVLIDLPLRIDDVAQPPAR